MYIYTTCTCTYYMYKMYSVCMQIVNIIIVEFQTPYSVEIQMTGHNGHMYNIQYKNNNTIMLKFGLTFICTQTTVHVHYGNKVY